MAYRFAPTLLLTLASVAACHRSENLGNPPGGTAGVGGPTGSGGAAAGSSGGDTSSAGSSGSAGNGDIPSAGSSGSAGTVGTSSAGTSGSAGTGGGGAGGALAACAPTPLTLLNPCVYTATRAPASLDLTVRGSLTGSGTTPPAGLVTRCLHQSTYYITVQDAAGESTAVGYDPFAAGSAPSSFAGLIGHAVSLRVRFAQAFQIDTDSVGFALQDSAGGLLFAAYGGTFYNRQGFTMLLAPADLQGIDITAAQPLCSKSSICSTPIMTSYALQFQGSSTITLLSSASGTVDAGGASYLAYHVSTLDPGQGCTDSQGWQGWSLKRDDL